MLAVVNLSRTCHQRVALAGAVFAFVFSGGSFLIAHCHLLGLQWF